MTAGLEQGALVGGDFVVVRPLGQGGMGAVYVAEQRSTGKLRALKIMHREMAPDASLQRRFEQEAKVGGLIRSGHVVEVIAAGLDAERGVPYLVMELLEGIDLRRHLTARGRLPPEEVRTLFEQLCHGVGAAHAAGVVHRDLKPENIFLARPSRVGELESVVKVLDFGIAKLAAEAGTRGTQAIGSPLWMAPEQTSPGPVSPATDVWALGLIGYELFTGEHFWKSAALPTATPTHLLREIVLDPIPPASARGGARLPPGFDAWFARCVARPPEARFQNADDAWRAMQSLFPDAGRIASARLPADAAPRTDAFAPTALAYPSDAPPPAPLAPATGRGETPFGLAHATPPPPVLAPIAPARSPRARLVRLALLGLALVALCGAPFRRHHSDDSSARASALTPSASPTPPPARVAAMPVVQGGAGELPDRREAADEQDEDEVPQPKAPLLVDGYSNPYDTARPPKDIEAPVQKVVHGRRVRLLTRVVANETNVAGSIVREAVDHSSWHYLQCFETTVGHAPALTDGTVTVSFDIFDQLPRRAKVESSTFANKAVGECVAQAVAGQTVNAAGPSGAGHVVYGFRFVVND